MTKWHMAGGESFRVVAVRPSGVKTVLVHQMPREAADRLKERLDEMGNEELIVVEPDLPGPGGPAAAGVP